MSEMKLKATHVEIPIVEYTFEEGVKHIRSGDIINFFSSHEETTIHRFTTEPILYFTGSKIYHTGVAVEIILDGEKRMMICESVGIGRRLLNINWFKDKKMEVHLRPEYVNQSKVERYMLDYLGEGYAFMKLILIGIREFFGVDAGEGKEGKKVCSETAAGAWRHGGMEFETVVLSPGKLRNVLTLKGVPPAFVINADKG